MGRLPLKVFSCSDSLDNPTWLKSLYNDCNMVLMKKSSSQDIHASMYLSICNIIATCIDRRGHEAKVKPTYQEQSIWHAINELINETELVSILKFRSRTHTK
jgi:hypothetical protein